jgi:hypothetical protein
MKTAHPKVLWISRPGAPRSADNTQGVPNLISPRPL